MGTPSRPDREERWSLLDPIFILGRQRTGTTIVWRALQAAGFHGFPEGQLWHDLLDSFARFRNPMFEPEMRRDFFTLGSGRNLELEKRFALMMDAFHRDHLPPDTVRWVDKSPGARPIRLAPVLAELFPKAQFIFVCRNPITTAHSTVNFLRLHPDLLRARDKSDPLFVLRSTCEDWVRVMETWRYVHPLLARRYIEVAQEDIALQPDRVARRLTTFLRTPQSSGSVAELFTTRRTNTAFPDKAVGDFIYPVGWSEEWKQLLADICTEEMAHWGYPLDFACPTGPDPALARRPAGVPPDLVTYLRWSEHERNKAAHERALAECWDLVERINQGRVMRVLNAIGRLLQRVGLRPPP